MVRNIHTRTVSVYISKWNIIVLYRYNMGVITYKITLILLGVGEGFMRISIIIACASNFWAMQNNDKFHTVYYSLSQLDRRFLFIINLKICPPSFAFSHIRNFVYSHNLKEMNRERAYIALHVSVRQDFLENINVNS